jgi:hypothetical protein
MAKMLVRRTPASSGSGSVGGGDMRKDAMSLSCPPLGNISLTRTSWEARQCAPPDGPSRAPKPALSRPRPRLEAQLELMQLFNVVVLRDGLQPEEVHRELCKIDEYREATGAEPV